MKNFDVFISYAHEDKLTADAACLAIENTGVRCWIAPRDVPPGSEWAAAIVDAIDNCRVMVLVFSSQTNKSKHIHREVQRAFDREVPVLPLRLENIIPEKSLAYYMGPVHWLDAMSPPLDQHLHTLAGSVKALVRDAAGLFSDLSDDLIAGLFKCARPVRLKADQPLFMAGDPGDGCYRIDKGLLRVSVVSPDGRERILAHLGSEAIVGELAVIDAQPRSASVAAVRDSELAFISRAAFHAFADDNPQVWRHVTSVLVHRLRATNNVLGAASFLSLKGRVAQAMLDLADEFGHEAGEGRILVQRNVTEDDLASMAGIARENVSRVLDDWMRRKLVTRQSGYYCIEPEFLRGPWISRECAAC